MFYVFCFQFQPISIHAPLTGSDHDLTIPINSVSTISIHAPLTGSDDASNPIVYYCQEISIHAPLTGSDVVPCI